MRTPVCNMNINQGYTYFPKIKKAHKLGEMNSIKDPQILLATIQNVVPWLSSTQDLCIRDTESEVAT